MVIITPAPPTKENKTKGGDGNGSEEESVSPTTERNVSSTCNRHSRMIELETEYFALRRKLRLLEQNYIRLFRQTMLGDKERYKAQHQQQVSEETQPMTLASGPSSASALSPHIISEYGHQVTLQPGGEIAPEDLVKKKAVRYERLLKPINGQLTREDETIKANLVRQDLERLGYIEWHEGERGPRKRALPLSRPRIAVTELSKKNILRKVLEIERLIEYQAAPPDTDKSVLRKSIHILMNLLGERLREQLPLDAHSSSPSQSQGQIQPHTPTQSHIQSRMNASLHSPFGLPQTTGVPTPFLMNAGEMDQGPSGINPLNDSGMTGMAIVSIPGMGDTANTQDRDSIAQGCMDFTRIVGHHDEGGSSGLKRRRSEDITMLDPTGRQQQMLQQQQQMLAQQQAAFQQQQIQWHAQQQQTQQRKHGQKQLQQGHTQDLVRLDPLGQGQELTQLLGPTQSKDQPTTDKTTVGSINNNVANSNTTTATNASNINTSTNNNNSSTQRRSSLQQPKQAALQSNASYVLEGLGSQPAVQHVGAYSNGPTAGVSTVVCPPFAIQDSLTSSHTFPNPPQLLAHPQVFAQFPSPAYGPYTGTGSPLPMLPYTMPFARALVPQKQPQIFSNPSHEEVGKQLVDSTITSL